MAPASPIYSLPSLAISIQGKAQYFLGVLCFPPKHGLCSAPPPRVTWAESGEEVVPQSSGPQTSACASSRLVQDPFPGKQRPRGKSGCWYQKEGNKYWVGQTKGTTSLRKGKDLYLCSGCSCHLDLPCEHLISFQVKANIPPHLGRMALSVPPALATQTLVATPASHTAVGTSLSCDAVTQFASCFSGWSFSAFLSHPSELLLHVKCAAARDSGLSILPHELLLARGFQRRGTINDTRV